MQKKRQTKASSKLAVPEEDEPKPFTLEQLSMRERQVLDFLLQDLRAWQIAEQLGISERTVKSHKKNLLEKMQVKSILQIALKLPRA